MFGIRLKEIRLSRGFTQKQLADASGLSQNGISQWENGEWVPSWDAVLKLVKALGVDCNAFCGPAAEAAPAPAAAADPKPKRGRPNRTNAATR